jgi:trk system potassium uptake protein TrkA
MAKTRTFAVVGLGSFGTTLCTTLAEKGATVIAMDRDPASVEHIKNSVSAAVLLDTTDEDSLLKAPLDEVDVAIVAIGDDIQTSILTTALLRQQGVPYIVARAVSRIHETVLRRIGANEVINAEIEMAVRTARRLVAPDVLDSIPLSADVSLSERIAPRYFSGKTLAGLDLENKLHLRVVGLLRSRIDLDDSGNSVYHDELIFPESGEVLEEGDRLLILGKNADLDGFRKIQGES